MVVLSLIPYFTAVEFFGTVLGMVFLIGPPVSSLLHRSSQVAGLEVSLGIRLS